MDLCRWQVTSDLGHSKQSRNATVDVGLDQRLQQSDSDCLWLTNRHRNDGIAQRANTLRLGCKHRRKLVNRRLDTDSSNGRDRFTEASGRSVFVSVRKNEYNVWL